MKCGWKRARTGGQRAEGFLQKWRQEAIRVATRVGQRHWKGSWVKLRDFKRENLQEVTIQWARRHEVEQGIQSAPGHGRGAIVLFSPVPAPVIGAWHCGWVCFGAGLGVGRGKEQV